MSDNHSQTLSVSQDEAAMMLSIRPWHPISEAPIDGSVILGLFDDGAGRLTRYINTSDYQGWETGKLISPIAWRYVSRDEIA